MVCDFAGSHRSARSLNHATDWNIEVLSGAGKSIGNFFFQRLAQIEQLSLGGNKWNHDLWHWVMAKLSNFKTGMHKGANLHLK